MKPLKEIRIDFDLYEKEKEVCFDDGIQSGIFKVVAFIESGQSLEGYFKEEDLFEDDWTKENLTLIANRLGIPLSDKEAE
jgi:hypothetical protein